MLNAVADSTLKFLALLPTAIKLIILPKPNKNHLLDRGKIKNSKNVLGLLKCPQKQSKTTFLTQLNKLYLSAVCDIAKKDIRNQPLIFGSIWNASNSGMICVKIPATNFSYLDPFKILYVLLNLRQTWPINAKEYNLFYVPLPYILHLIDSCPFSKQP